MMEADIQYSSQILTTNMSTPNFLQAWCCTRRPINSAKHFEWKLNSTFHMYNTCTNWMNADLTSVLLF